PAEQDAAQRNREHSNVSREVPFAIAAIGVAQVFRLDAGDIAHVADARNVSGGLSRLIKDHLPGGASRLAALLLPHILPVWPPHRAENARWGPRRQVVAPIRPGPPRRVLCAVGWRPGAALRNLVLAQTRPATWRHADAPNVRFDAEPPQAGAQARDRANPVGRAKRQQHES